MDWSQLPELVKDTELNTRFDSGYTIHGPDEDAHPFDTRHQEVWKRIRTIGQGGFSYVCLEECVRGQDEGTPQARAVKVIRLTQESDIGLFSRELEATAKFSQKKFQTYFVKSFGWFRGPDELSISLEYFPLGDLQSYININPCILEGGARHITWQILQGLNAMHNEGFAHRDLKPANILIKACPPSPWWVKLSDFGLSKRAGMTQKHSLAGGTHGFIAPDILRLYREGSSESLVTIPHVQWVAGDLWSLGEVVVRIMSGKTTFRSDEHMIQYSLQLKPFPNSDLVDRGLSLDAVDFVQKTMASEAVDRMTSKNGLSHDWINKTTDTKATSSRSESVSSRTVPSIAYRDWSTSASAQPVEYKSASETTNSRPVITSAPETVASSVTTEFQSPSDMMPVNPFDKLPFPHWSSSGNIGTVDSLPQSYDRLDEQPPPNSNSTGETLQNSPAHKSPTMIENSVNNALRNKDPVELGPVSSQRSEITKDPIFGIEFSPDSRTLFASTKEAILSWDCSSQQVERLQRDSSHVIKHFSVSPDGQRAALVTDSFAIQVAYLNLERVFNTVMKYQWGLTYVAFSYDSDKIACGFSDGSVCIIDSVSGKPIGNPLQAKSKPIIWVAFTDSNHVISIDERGRLQTWAPSSSYDLLRRKLGDRELAVASSRDSGVIAVTSGEEIRVWARESSSASYTCVGTISNNKSPNLCMALSASGDHLVICRATGRCTVWRVQETTVWSAVFILSNEPKFPIAISPDNRQLVFGTEGGSIQTTDITEAIQINCLRGHFNKAMFINISDDGTKVASICKRSAVRQHSDDGQMVVIWDLETESVSQVLQVGGNGIYDAVFSHDSQRLAVIFDNGVTTIWGVSTGDRIATIENPLSKPGSVHCAAVSPDLSRVAIVHQHGSEDLERFRVNTEASQHIAQGKSPRETSTRPDAICFLNEGTKVAISDSYGIHIYEIRETGLKHTSDRLDDSPIPFIEWDFPIDQKSSAGFKSLIRTFGKPEETVQKPGESYSKIPRLVASADSGSIVYFSKTGNAYFYSSTEVAGIKRSKFSKDTRLTGRVACISPSWQLLAVISPEQGVNIWDVSSTKAISFLGINKGKAKAITFSADSKSLFVLTEKELFVYDAVYLRVPPTVLPLSVPVRSLQVSSQLERVILALSNNTIEIWDYRKACITQTFYGNV